MVWPVRLVICLCNFLLNIKCLQEGSTFQYCNIALELQLLTTFFPLPCRLKCDIGTCCFLVCAIKRIQQKCTYEDALVLGDRTLEEDPALLLLCWAASPLWISVFPNIKQGKMTQTSPAKTLWKMKRRGEKLRHRKRSIPSLCIVVTVTKRQTKAQGN